MNKIIKYGLLGLSAPALLLTSSITFSDEGGPSERAIEYRESIMNIFSWNLKAMGSVVKGEVPYDKEAFARYAKDLASAAHLDLLAGFPEGSDEGETDAKAEIWMKMDDFKQKYETLQQKSNALVEAAGSGDLEVIRPAFGDTANSCKECHKAYKE